MVSVLNPFSDVFGHNPSFKGMQKTAPNTDESSSKESNNPKENKTTDFECQLLKNVQDQTLHM